MKGYFMMIKKTINLLLWTSIMICSLQAVMIHVKDVRESTKKSADQYLTQQGFPLYLIPSQFINEYHQKIDATIESLQQQAARSGRSYVDDSEIASQVYFQFSKFCENLRTVVLQVDIDSRVTSTVQELFRTQNTSTSSIPSTLYHEFLSKRELIMRRLRNIMTIDNRTYVRTYEIERISKEELEPFITKVKQYFQKQKEENNSFSLWNFLFGASQEALPNQPTEQETTIKRANLGSKITQVLARQLKQQGIDAQRIPQRAMASYDYCFQNTLKNLQERMNTYHRDYVTVAEIELLIHQKINPLIDTLKLTGKECSICLDNYKSGQSIGNLECGHIFHKECIKTWFHHKQTCPECSRQWVSIASEEVLP